MDNLLDSGSAMKIPTPEKIQEEKMILAESLRALVSEITRDTKIDVTENDDGFILKVPLPGNRSQKVYVSIGRRDADGENLFQIYTVCTEATGELYEFALRMNMELDYGALALQEMYGRDFLVIVDTQLVRTAQPVEVEKSILTLAEVGDDIEKILTGEDIR